MLQTLFNDLALAQRPLRERYVIELLAWRYPPIPELNGAASVLLRFISPRRNIIFDVHGYFTTDGKRVQIHRSGMLDPKNIVLCEVVRLYTP